jgi:hypothetical protein
MWDKGVYTRPGGRLTRLGCAPVTSCPRICPVLAVGDSDMATLLRFEHWQQWSREVDQSAVERIDAEMGYWI